MNFLAIYKVVTVNAVRYLCDKFVSSSGNYKRSIPLFFLHLEVKIMQFVV